MAKDLWTAWTTGTEGEEIRNVLTEEYRDHGAWARHYSTVRMTLGTFFLSAATGVIYLRWDKPECGTAILAVMILLIGVILYLRFSWLTFTEMNRQRQIVAAYRTALTKEEATLKPIAPIWKWDSAYICLTLGLLFLAFDSWWLYGPHAASKTLEFKIPIAVQVGKAPAVSIQVPVKVTVPVKTEH